MGTTEDPMVTYALVLRDMPVVTIASQKHGRCRQSPAGEDAVSFAGKAE